MTKYEGALYEVEFTQFLRPNGRKKPVFMPTSKTAADKAEEIKSAGYKFEVEVLTTGHVSATIADPIKEEDLAIVLVPNGTGLSESVSKMILDFTIPN